jgi:cytochrome c556
VRKKTLVEALIGMVVIGAMVGGATVAFAQDDVIKQRQDNRKQAGAAMRAIKGVIDSKGDAKVVVEQAAKLKELQTAFTKLFPAGSDQGKTEALPVVWTDRNGFMAAGQNADAAYDKLALAGGSGDIAAITAAFAEAGKACGACHQKYRAKTN